MEFDKKAFIDSGIISLLLTNYLGLSNSKSFLLILLIIFLIRNKFNLQIFNFPKSKIDIYFLILLSIILICFWIFPNPLYILISTVLLIIFFCTKNNNKINQKFNNFLSIFLTIFSLVNILNSGEYTLVNKATILFIIGYGYNNKLLLQLIPLSLGVLSGSLLSIIISIYILYIFLTSISFNISKLYKKNLIINYRSISRIPFNIYLFFLFISLIGFLFSGVLLPSGENLRSEIINSFIKGDFSFLEPLYEYIKIKLSFGESIRNQVNYSIINAFNNLNINNIFGCRYECLSDIYISNPTIRNFFMINNKDVVYKLNAHNYILQYILDLGPLFGTSFLILIFIRFINKFKSNISSLWIQKFILVQVVLLTQPSNLFDPLLFGLLFI